MPASPLPAYLFSLLLAAVVSSAALWLTDQDPLSVTFVSLAIGTYMLLLLGLSNWERRLGAIRKLVGLPPEKLEGSPMQTVARLFSSSLVKTPQGTLRTTSASTWLRADGALAGHIHAPAWLGAGQAILVSLGLFGTFFGLSYGLLQSIPCIDGSDPGHAACLSALGSGGDLETRAMERGMSILLGGARTAFSKSVAGIGLGVAWLLLWRARDAAFKALLRDLAEGLDALVPYRSEAILVLERLEALRVAQPDTRAFSDAAGIIAGTAETLAAAVGSLERSSLSLSKAGEQMSGAAKGFSAEVMGQKVAEGMEGAVQRQLKPSLERIDGALRNLEAIKRSTDEEVKKHLQQMLEDLRKEALSPLSQELQATNANVRAVAGTVGQVASAAQASAVAVAGLGQVLERFQNESLGRLEGFSKDLSVSVRTAGTEVAGVVRLAGKEASDVMGGARSQLAAGIQTSLEGIDASHKKLTVVMDRAMQHSLQTWQAQLSQLSNEHRQQLAGHAASSAQMLEVSRAALQSTIQDLQNTFDNESMRRSEMEAATRTAIGQIAAVVAQVSQVAATTAQADAQLRSSTVEAAQALRRSLEALDTGLGRYESANSQLHERLSASLNKVRAEEEHFFVEADMHLAATFEGLHRLLEATLGVAQQIREIEAQRG